MHQRDAVATPGLVHEVGGNENGDVVVPGEIDHELPQDIAGDGVNAGRRLIEDQEFRLMHHGDGERQALADAERQVVRHGVEGIGEAETSGHLVHPRRDGSLGHEEQAGMKHEVLPHGELRIQGERLRHVAHAATGRDVLGVDLVPEQRGPAFGRRQQAGQHFHGGGFAAAVRADEAEDLSAADSEIRVIHR